MAGSDAATNRERANEAERIALIIDLLTMKTAQGRAVIGTPDSLLFRGGKRH
jgi:hypothetical protein